MKGKHVDLSSDPSQVSDDASSLVGRRYIGITFECCDVYTRVYVNRDETAYVGNCPKCARQVRIQIGPGGTSQRFFVAR